MVCNFGPRLPATMIVLTKDTNKFNFCSHSEKGQVVKRQNNEDEGHIPKFSSLHWFIEDNKPVCT